jgi:hypothetical protein
MIFLAIERRQLLFKCLLGSAAFHTLLLVIFFTHPLLLKTSLVSHFVKAAAPDPIFIPKEERLRADEILEQAFEEFIIPPPATIKQTRVQESLPAFDKEPLAESVNIAFPSTRTPVGVSAQSFFPESLIVTPGPQALVSIERMPFVSRPELETRGSLDPSLDLNVPLILLEKSDLAQELLAPLSEERQVPVSQDDPSHSAWAAPQIPMQQISPLPKELPPLAAKQILPTAPRPLMGKPLISAARPLMGKPLISAAPSLSEADLFGVALPAPEAFDQEFDVAVQFMPLEEGKGYFFTLSLTPRFDMEFERIPQLFNFFIDRSNQIENHRFSTFKKAVAKALTCMKEGDSFNIYFFDRKISAFKEHPVQVNKKTIQQAEVFLEKEQQGGSASDRSLYTALEKALPLQNGEEQIQSAILLTDGSALLSSKNAQKELHKWLEKSKNRTTLYTATAGQSSDLGLLNWLSQLCGGQLMYSDTHAAFGRKLGKLMLTLKEPITSDVTVGVVTHDAQTRVELLARPMTILYNNKTHVLQGKINELSDFTLIIQGKNKERWLSMEQVISFKAAKENKALLQKKWTLHEAKLCYENFVKEGKSSDLKKAQELMKPLSQIAFE